MSHFKNLSKVGFLVIGVAIFFTSCGSDTDTDGLAKTEDVAVLEERVDRLSQQIDKLSSTTVLTTIHQTTSPAITTTVVEPTIEDVPEFGPQENCIEYRDNLEAKIAELNLPAGVFFYGECREDSMWFPAYHGSESDIWYANWNRGFRGAETDYYEGPLSSWPEIPMGARHPAFPQAATLSELVALPEGSVVCKHYGENSQQLFIVGAYVKAYYFRETMAQANGDPYIEAYEVSTSNRYKMPATDWGVSPFEDGVWSVAYVSIGACG